MPLASSDSGVTWSPAANRCSRSRRLTGCVVVRNGPIGIDVFLCGPRCFPICICSGFWPPMKPARMLWEPDRDFWPFWPRPEVLPVPLPVPRPTRLRSRREPSAGVRLWSANSSVSVSGVAI